MDLRKLEYFVSVADEGNITAAAGKLHMSQPPLSTQLRLLEEELGVKLFERGSRSIRLTDAGTILYHRARGILDMTEDTVREVKDFGDGLGGSLRLGVISSAGSEQFYRNIQTFKERYPRVLFEIREGNTYVLLELLRQGQIEAALLRTPFATEGMQCRYLEREAMMAVGAEEYFAGIFPKAAPGNERSPEGAASIPLRALVGRPLIVYRRWESTLLGEFHNLGEEPFILCRNDDARTTAAWADAGLGIGILPKSAAENTSWRTGIRRAAIEEETLHTKMALVTRDGKYVSNAARRFVEEFC